MQVVRRRERETLALALQMYRSPKAFEPAPLQDTGYSNWHVCCVWLIAFRVPWGMDVKIKANLLSISSSNVTLEPFFFSPDSTTTYLTACRRFLIGQYEPHAWPWTNCESYNSPIYEELKTKTTLRDRCLHIEHVFHHCTISSGHNFIYFGNHTPRQAKISTSLETVVVQPRSGRRD